MATSDHTTPDEQTVAGDRRDARAAHRADPTATPDEAERAPTEAPPGVAAAYQQAVERGADARGEGRT